MSSAAPVFTVKQRVYALRQGTFHQATVLEVGTDAGGAARYYVHYQNQDNRLDCWLPAEHLKERVGSRQPHYHGHDASLAGGGVATRRQQQRGEAGGGAEGAAGAHGAAPGGGASKHAKSAKGGGQFHHDAAVSTQRARRDSAFFSRPKNVGSLCIGPHEVEAWYFSPYHLARPAVRRALEVAPHLVAGDAEMQLSAVLAAPAAAAVAEPCTLHLCPCCLEPFMDGGAAARHLRLACARRPPGSEIYRDPVRQLLVVEVDGAAEPVFCQHLALLSKLFLEHKALDHDMTPFLFYVLCYAQPYGLEVLGYFSKEKVTLEQYNLSCILVLPQFQSRGIGRFLIELSYEISRREGKVGTPEKPLSDLGEKLYLRYWCDAVTLALARALEEGHCVTQDYIVQATAILQVDVQRALAHLGLLGGGGGAHMCISEEVIQKTVRKRLGRESDMRNYTFYPHLLSWCPGMYAEVRGQVPAPAFVAATPAADALRDE